MSNGVNLELDRVERPYVSRHVDLEGRTSGWVPGEAGVDLASLRLDAYESRDHDVVLRVPPPSEVQVLDNGFSALALDERAALAARTQIRRAHTDY